MYSGLVAKSCLTLETPWTVAHQVPLSMGFPRQEYSCGLPFPSPRDIPDPGTSLLHLQMKKVSDKLPSPKLKNFQ